ncbi:YitT family protein [Candidatus Mycoplasma mahonii]|uniref:YitT family protein n=1 Tax=Candidatus Mycoplasma mahonii TaxID=3004105 RepID=UPI0026EC8BC2|nr:YitT family protein [Candidatus Mycoplasma mahonii]WKX02711.1 YitT family protein [Candidatus Mycoplasma mahonii]
MIRKFYPFKSVSHKKWFSFLMIIFASVLYTTGINAFIQTAGTFSLGVGSIAGLITYSYKELLSYFSLFYLLLNLPLIIFFWNKVKKIFMYKTLVFLLSQATFSLIFIFSDLLSWFNDVIDRHDIQKDGWPIIVLPIFGGIICGSAIAISYMFGGSSGGTDIIVFYLSTKKKIAIGKLALIVSMTILLFSFSISMLLYSDKRNNWYLTLLGTLISTIIASLIIDMLYPKYSKVQLEIHSKMTEEVKSYLSNINNPHSYYSFMVTSGYTKRKREVIQTSILLLEAKRMIKDLKKIDPKVWVSVTKVNTIIGNFNTITVD